MTTEPNADLFNRITRKRSQLEAFIARAVPRKKRLLNLTLVAGTLAAALTAAPAAGGQSFTAWLTRTFGLESPSWQILCGVASICSVTATVATQLLKSQNVEEQVTKAQSCRAKLEVLEIGLSTGEIDNSRATSEYMRCVEEAAFLDHS
jgi:MFS family permease